MKEVYSVFSLMKEHANWSFLELYNLPIALRTWFVQEYAQRKEKEKKAAENHRS